MTFVLKEFDQLAVHFGETVRVLLQNHKKTKVEDLPEHRKYQIQFLQATIAEMSRQIEEQKKNPQGNASCKRAMAKALYAAMLVVRKDIVDNLSTLQTPEGSLLHGRLEDGMGITNQNKPDAEQLAECFRQYNVFSKLMFNERDSRKGFNKENALKSVEFDKLIQLAKLSYDLDKQANLDVISALKPTGKSTPVHDDYQLRPVINTDITKPFGTFDELSKKLNDLKLLELGDKKAKNIAALDAPRYAQYGFLESIKDALIAAKNQISPNDKVAILAGAMYIVRGQIAQEYHRDPLYVKSIAKSTTHDGLTKILKTSEEQLEDVEALVSAANHFIRHMTIEPGQPKKDEKEATKTSIREKTIFSDIKPFVLTPVLTLAQEMIRYSREEALKICVIATKPKEEKSSSFFGSWFKKAPAPLDEDEKELKEAKPAAAAPAKM